MHGLKKRSRRAPLMLLAAALVFLSVSQYECAKKSKVAAEASPTSPVRIALLPFNVPEKSDIRWTAMAGPVLVARVGSQSKDLEIIPLWQSMPAAIEAGGLSRSLTAESASNVANWLSAKWSTLGEFAPARTGFSMIVDFIPAKNSLVPFRYLRAGKIESLGSSGLPEALNQFLSYLEARLVQEIKKPQQSMPPLRDLAEALDREYGWFTEADPGKAQEIVTNLAGSDMDLAKSLFSPTLYPALAESKEAPENKENKGTK